MKIYTVGGAVRDTLMGLTPKDVDYLVTGSTPEEMNALGYKQVGADFPVFLHPDTGEEYALARTERKSGRGYNGFITDFNPNVTVFQDLERRDLTINAIAQNEAGGLIDPFLGAQDIDNRVLRHVSSAFADDPVRVLRLARFHARYGPEWEIAPETLSFCACMVANRELEYLTRERVVAELHKALHSPYPDLFFKLLIEINAMEVLFPEIKGDLWLKVMRNIDAPKMRWAMLTGFVKEPEKFEARLGMPGEYTRYSKMYRSYDVLAHPVQNLYVMDAYRQRQLVEEFIADMTLENANTKVLKRAWRLTQGIGFENLSFDQRVDLQGQEIGVAIKALRMAVWDMAPQLNREQQILEDAKVFAQENLVEGCKEIMEFSKTTILKAGVVRRCADILNQLGAGHSLPLAHSLFQTAAIEHVARGD